MSLKRDSGWVSRAILAVALSWVLGGWARAEILSVPDDYPTIQEAIDAAQDGDEIIVAPDTYSEAIDLLGKAVWLHSSDGPEVTIIDATGLGGAAVTCANLEGDDTVFEGFTVTGGDPGMSIEYSYPTVLNCVFSENDGDGMYCTAADPSVTDSEFIANGEAGVYNVTSSPMFQDCEFSDNLSSGMYNYDFANATLSECSFIGNSASKGGAMRNEFSSPTVTRCVFTDNSASDGAGIFNYFASPMISDCTFTENTLSAYGDGGGVFSQYGSPTIVNCRFLHNSGGTSTSGGGLFCEDGDPLIINCLFLGNDTFDGAAMSYANDCAPLILNCVFLWNRASNDGGGFFSYYSTPILVNCTFTNNIAGDGGAFSGNYVTAANCIIWDNAEPQVYGQAITITYSCVENGHQGVGNIESDPLFEGAPYGDLHLSPASPCIDAGDNTTVPPDVFDLDQDGDIDEPIPFDLDGNPRFVDDPDTEDTGNGDPPIVDMGAYEFQACPADFDYDGDVDTADLLYLLGAWGTSGGDVDGDEDTDTADLLALLGAWGDCP